MLCGAGKHIIKLSLTLRFLNLFYEASEANKEQCCTILVLYLKWALKSCRYAIHDFCRKSLIY